MFWEAILVTCHPFFVVVFLIAFFALRFQIILSLNLKGHYWKIPDDQWPYIREAPYHYVLYCTIYTLALGTNTERPCSSPWWFYQVYFPVVRSGGICQDKSCCEHSKTEANILCYAQSRSCICAMSFWLLPVASFERVPKLPDQWGASGCFIFTLSFRIC